MHGEFNNETVEWLLVESDNSDLVIRDVSEREPSSSSSEPDCIDVNVALAESYDDLTNKHEVRAVFGTIYSSLFVIGMTFNVGVIISVYRNRKLRSASNIFLVNLMLADLLLCLTAIPVTPVAVVTKQWIFGAFLCRFLPLSQSWSVLITSWSLTAIAVDKYVHIRDATLSAVSQLQACLITVVIFIVSGLVNIPYMLSYRIIDGRSYVNASNSSVVGFCGEFCEELNWPSDLVRRIYGTSIMGLQFVFPMIIISFCYIRILIIVGRDLIIHNISFAYSLTSKQRKDAIRKKRKVNYILIGMVMAFIASWFPLTLVNILRDFSILPMFIRLQPWLWTLIVHIIAMTTVLWNPLLFFYLTRKGVNSQKRMSTTQGGGLSTTGNMDGGVGGVGGGGVGGVGGIQTDTSSFINGAYDWIKRKSVRHPHQHCSSSSFESSNKSSNFKVCFDNQQELLENNNKLAFINHNNNNHQFNNQFNNHDNNHTNNHVNNRGGGGGALKNEYIHRNGSVKHQISSSKVNHQSRLMANGNCLIGGGVGPNNIHRHRSSSTFHLNTFIEENAGNSTGNNIQSVQDKGESKKWAESALTSPLSQTKSTLKATSFFSKDSSSNYDDDDESESSPIFEDDESELPPSGFSSSRTPLICINGTTTVDSSSIAPPKPSVAPPKPNNRQRQDSAPATTTTTKNRSPYNDNMTIKDQCKNQQNDEEEQQDDHEKETEIMLMIEQEEEDDTVVSGPSDPSTAILLPPAVNHRYRLRPTDLPPPTYHHRPTTDLPPPTNHRPTTDNRIGNKGQFEEDEDDDDDDDDQGCKQDGGNSIISRTNCNITTNKNHQHHSKISFLSKPPSPHLQNNTNSNAKANNDYNNRNLPSSPSSSVIYVVFGNSSEC